MNGWWGRRATALALGCAGALSAQRAPVLQHVDVPHPYYWRNLYVPQVTSGPHAVAWADSATLVYAMGGTLWRQRLGTTGAEQLTDGPGYDHQPDVTRDGRSVVYTTYAKDAYELQLLDLRTGSRRALTANAAVNVEPRWSPDGKRLAWVSTQFRGRFHVFVAEFDGTQLQHVRRVSADSLSPLPRYYYDKRDQALSPSWSPRGDELVYLSNAGHIWGSGTIWRAKLPAIEPAGAVLAGREIVDEETTWGARPDWSPDGRRLVIASYAGRPWHQLVLVSDSGRSPIQLTHGDFDAFAPRWSPDGSRIAYIANAMGNTDIRLVDVRTGAVSRLPATSRHHRAPTGTIALSVLDAGGRLVAARVSVTGADGRAWTPDSAWRQADDAYDRRARPFEVAYFHTSGRATLTVPAGEYTVTVNHGLEFAPARVRTHVRAGATAPLHVRLGRVADLARDGWHSADQHVHMNYGGPYRATPATLALQAIAEDVRLIEALIVNKESRMMDLAAFRGGRESSLDARTSIVFGQEFHTSFWGHAGLPGITDHVLLPGYAAYQGTAASSPVPTNTDVARLAHAQGGLFGYVHPFDEIPDPTNAGAPLSHALPVDVALGLVDYMEILGFADHLSTARVWYRLLNAGYRVPAGAGTDAMTNYASLRGPVGLNRVYVRSAPTPAAMRAAIRAGRTMATNGPLVSLTVNGAGPGADLARVAGARMVRVRARLRSIVGVDHLEIVANGVVAAELTLSGPRTNADTAFDLAVTGSAWITLRARGDSARAAILDMYPFATTSPVYVTVGGAPLRRADDVRWLLAWIDRIEAAARGHSGYNSDAEKSRVLAQISDARAALTARLSP